VFGEGERYANFMDATGGGAVLRLCVGGGLLGRLGAGVMRGEMGVFLAGLFLGAMAVHAAYVFFGISFR
jgi:hypothetical protein